MKRVVMLVVMAMGVFGGGFSVALATEPLAYADAFAVGAGYGQQELDTELLRLSSRAYGGQILYARQSVGLAAKLGIAVAKITANSGELELQDLKFSDEVPLLSLELSKRVHDFGSGIQLGVYGKFENFFADLAGNKQEISTYRSFSGYLLQTNSSQQLRLKNLSGWEFGLLGQKDWEAVHLYGGPLAQLIRTDVEYQHLTGVSFESVRKYSLRERSVLGGVVGVRTEFGKGLSVGFDALLKEHISFNLTLQKSLF